MYEELFENSTPSPVMLPVDRLPPEVSTPDTNLSVGPLGRLSFSTPFEHLSTAQQVSEDSSVVKSLQNKLKSKEFSLKSMMEECTTLQNENVELEDKNNVLEERVKRLEQDLRLLRDADRECELSRTQRERESDELTELRSTLASYVSRASTMEEISKRAADHEDTAIRLQDELDVMRGKFSKALSEKADLEGENTRLNKENLVAKAGLVAVKNELSQCQLRVEEQKTMLANLDASWRVKDEEKEEKLVDAMLKVQALELAAAEWVRKMAESEQKNNVLLANERFYETQIHLWKDKYKESDVHCEEIKRQSYVDRNHFEERISQLRTREQQLEGSLQTQTIESDYLKKALLDSVASLDSHKTSHREKVKALLEDAEIRENQYRELRTTFDQLQEIYKEMGHSYQLYKNTVEENEKKHTTEVSEYKQLVSRLEEQLADERRAEADIQQVVSQWKDLCNQHLTSIRQFEAELLRTHQSYTSLKAEHEKVAAEKYQLGKELTTVITDAVHLRLKNTELETENGLLTTNAHTLENRLLFAENERDELKKMLSQCEEAIDCLREELKMNRRANQRDPTVSDKLSREGMLSGPVAPSARSVSSSLSMTSQHSNLSHHAFDLKPLVEPDFDMESRSIPSSWFPNTAEVTGARPKRKGHFKYRQDSESRRLELIERNKKVLPHLKSVYPIETCNRGIVCDGGTPSSSETAADDVVNTEPSSGTLSLPTKRVLFPTNEPAKRDDSEFLLPETPGPMKSITSQSNKGSLFSRFSSKLNIAQKIPHSQQHENGRDNSERTWKHSENGPLVAGSRRNKLQEQAKKDAAYSSAKVDKVRSPRPLPKPLAFVVDNTPKKKTKPTKNK